MTYFESDSQDEVLDLHEVLDPHGEEHGSAVRLEPCRPQVLQQPTAP